MEHDLAFAHDNISEKWTWVMLPPPPSPPTGKYTAPGFLLMWSSSLYQQEEAGGGAECWGGATHHHLCQPEEGSWRPCQVTGKNGGQYTGKFVYYTVKTIVNDHHGITAKWYFKRVGLWWVICPHWNMQRIIIWLYCDRKKILFQWAFQLFCFCCFFIVITGTSERILHLLVFVICYFWRVGLRQIICLHWNMQRICGYTVVKK